MLYDLSLYSTATQNHSCWVLALDPQHHNIALGKEHVYKYLKTLKFALLPNTKHKICVTPNAKPQREPMEYRLRWVPNTKFSHWPCTFHVVCAHVICVGYLTRTQFAVEYGLFENMCMAHLVLLIWKAAILPLYN